MNQKSKSNRRKTKQETSLSIASMYRIAKKTNLRVSETACKRLAEALETVASLLCEEAKTYAIVSQHPKTLKLEDIDIAFQRLMSRISSVRI